eukprot:257601-Chlamydomonas_euryale.AAC.1
MARDDEPCRCCDSRHGARHGGPVTRVWRRTPRRSAKNSHENWDKPARAHATPDNLRWACRSQRARLGGARAGSRAGAVAVRGVLKLESGGSWLYFERSLTRHRRRAVRARRDTALCARALRSTGSVTGRAAASIAAAGAGAVLPTMVPCTCNGDAQPERQ